MTIGVAALAMQGFSTLSDYENAQMLERQGDLQARMEDVAALQRETDRKAELTRAISTQRASASAAGITLSGSPLSVIREQINQEQRDTSRDRFNTSVNKLSSIYAARINASGMRTRGATSLLGSGYSYMQNKPVSE